MTETDRIAEKLERSEGWEFVEYKWAPGSVCEVSGRRIARVAARIRNTKIGKTFLVHKTIAIDFTDTLVVLGGGELVLELEPDEVDRVDVKSLLA